MALKTDKKRRLNVVCGLMDSSQAPKKKIITKVLKIFTKNTELHVDISEKS